MMMQSVSGETMWGQDDCPHADADFGLSLHKVFPLPPPFLGLRGERGRIRGGQGPVEDGPTEEVATATAARRRPPPAQTLTAFQPSGSLRLT